MSQFGIIWFENYAFPHPKLKHSHAMAADFASTLTGKKVFEYGDGQAIQGTFKDEVEKVDLLYFAGHGTSGGPVVDLGAKIIGPADVRFGVGDLAFAALDCCHVLDPAYRADWHPAFQGLHYLLGFSATVWQHATRGQVFAQLLNDDVEVGEAWRRAALETIEAEGERVPWAFVRAVHDGAVAVNLSWGGMGRKPLRDPEPPLAFVHRTEKGEMVFRPPARADRVHLFRTPRSALTEARKQSLATLLGMGPEVGEAARDGSVELRGRGVTLEVYEASGAFWLRRDTPERQGEFAGFALDRPLPEVPSAGEAKERARDYLRRHQLLSGATVQLVAETEEEQYRREESGEGWVRKRRTLACHVSHPSCLEGLPVFGPGARLRVSYEGPEPGEVADFRRKAVPETRTVPVLTPTQVIDRLKDEVFPELPVESVTVNDVRLGYYSLPPRDEQDYLLPAYELKGNVDLDGVTYNFIRYLQAVPEASRPAESTRSVFHLPTVFT